MRELTQSFLLQDCAEFACGIRRETLKFDVVHGVGLKMSNDVRTGVLSFDCVLHKIARVVCVHVVHVEAVQSYVW